MRLKFDQQLQRLNDEMIRMGTMIEENIQEAIETLVNFDEDRAKEIIRRDSAVDEKQKEIEGICFHLLIQQQPVARDLRAITAAMKMVTDMERIGDHAADISEMTIFMAGKPKHKSMETILNMASEAMIMLIQSIDAFVKKDMELAEHVIAQDDVVDNLFDRVKMELIDLIRSNPEGGEQEIDMLMIAKYLERIADHSVNLAEWVEYSLDDHMIKDA